MTNTEMLERAIKDKGLKKGYIADRLKLSRSGLVNLINNRSDFRASQIQTLCEILDLDDAQRNAIFFAADGG